MSDVLKRTLDAMPIWYRREAELAWKTGIPYMAWGVVWGARGPETAIVL